MTLHGINHGLSGRVGGLALSGALHIAVGIFLIQSQTDGAPLSGAPGGDAGTVMVVELVRAPAGGPRSPTLEADLPSPDAATSTPALPSTDVGPADAPPRPRAAGAATGSPVASSTRFGEARRLSDLPDADAAAYRRRLESHLARHRVYPARAVAAGRQGLVVVHFTMTRDGRVQDAWIESSSGESDIDTEALAAIFRAQPLPVLPEAWPARLDVSLPVNFTLG